MPPGEHERGRRKELEMTVFQPCASRDTLRFLFIVQIRICKFLCYFIRDVLVWKLEGRSSNAGPSAVRVINLIAPTIHGCMP